MKKICIPVVAASLLLGTVSCGTNFGAGAWEKKGLFGSGPAHIANPFTDYATLGEAELAAGFPLEVPERIKGYDGRLIQVMDGTMIQVIHLRGESRLFIRKAAGAGDVSGDYTGYPEMRSIPCGKFHVTVKGSGGKVKNAVWTSGGYAYAVMSDDALDLDFVRDLVGRIK